MSRKLFLCLPLLAAIAAADWIGVGPAGGPVYAGAVSPSNPNIIYVGGLSYPLHIIKSTDAGSTWAFTAGTLSMYPFRMTVANDDPDLVYAVMGTFAKTTDGGASWQSLGAPSGCYFQDIDVNPRNSQEAYGAGYSNMSTCQAVLAHTTDGGESWSLSVCDTANSYGYRVTADPTDTNIVYTAGFRSSGRTLIWESTDRGETWTGIDMGINGSAPYGLHVSPLDPRVIVVGLYASGIVRSTDAGATWNRVINLSNFYNLASVPNQPAVLYASANTVVYRSDDTGHTWTQTDTGIGGKDAYCLMTSAADNGVVYCGTRAGIYKSTNRGGTWQDMTRLFGFNEVNPITLASDRRTVYAECWNNAVFKSTNLGSDWTRCPDFLTCGMICSFAVQPADPDVVWAFEGSG